MILYCRQLSRCAMVFDYALSPVYFIFRLRELLLLQLLTNVTGSQKVSVPMTIVVCGMAKMFVGELVEIGKWAFLLLLKWCC